MSKYDLAVAYRIYPKVSKPAMGLPFSEDKFRLSEICLSSFKKSLGSLRVKVWVLLDGCPEQYSELFRRYFEARDLVLMPLDGVGNLATFAKQLEVLLEQDDSEFVYFAEDDYVYLENRFTEILDFAKAHDDVDFVTPYDHLDCYTEEMHRHPSWLRVHGGRHWRTAASTCLTFLTRRETLKRSQSVFRSYSHRNHDCSVWLSLTKHRVFNPVQFLRFTYRDPLSAKIIAMAWIHGWPQILFGRQMKLWVPIPAIATHLSHRHLSPTIDWAHVMEREAQSIMTESSRA